MLSTTASPWDSMSDEEKLAVQLCIEQLLLLLLDDARTRDYKKCYLETLDRMYQANELYQKNEFELLDKPMGMTGHDSCDRWYLLHL